MFYTRERDTKVLERVISFSAQLRATKKVVAEEVSPPKKSFTRPMTKETHVLEKRSCRQTGRQTDAKTHRVAVILLSDI